MKPREGLFSVGKKRAAAQVRGIATTLPEKDNLLP